MRVLLLFFVGLKVIAYICISVIKIKLNQIKHPMDKKYDYFISAVAYAMNDHSYNTKWYYDFDTQDTEADIEDMELHPDPTHRLVSIDPLGSREGFMHMEEFADGGKNLMLRSKLYKALEQRHPFSAFVNAVNYNNLREAWFKFKNEKMKEIVEEWMEDNDIIYEDGIFKCEHAKTYEFCD